VHSAGLLALEHFALPLRYYRYAVWKLADATTTNLWT
jgi:hypothetical protein